MRIPSASDLKSERRRELEAQMAEYMRKVPGPSREAIAARASFNKMLQPDALDKARPLDLKELATSREVASVGFQASFLGEWKRLGDKEAGERMREVLRFLLYGDGEVAARLDAVLGGSGLSMTGLSVQIATKALAMAFPNDFLPIPALQGRDGGTGKREILQELFGISLPSPDSYITQGELVVLANGILVDLVRPPFEDLEHAGGYLWSSTEHLRKTTGRVAAASPSKKRQPVEEVVCARCGTAKRSSLMYDLEKRLCVDCA